MNLSGDLRVVSLPLLLRTLVAYRATGVLAITRGEDRARVVFRKGRVLFASAASAREGLGCALVAQGLVSFETLQEALRLRRQEAREQRLGSVLLRLGAVEWGQLEACVTEQVVRTLRELLAWRSGSFHFDSVPVGDRGEVGVAVGPSLWGEAADCDLELASPLSLAVARPDSSSRSPEIGPPGTLRTVGSVLGGQPAGVLTAEMVLSLLDAASGSMQRGALLARHPGGFRGIAAFGGGKDEVPASIRALEIPAEEPSMLAEISRSGKAYFGPLYLRRADRKLISALGGSIPGEVALVPIPVRGRTQLVFYGDNGRQLRPLPRLRALEDLATEIGEAIETGAA